MLKPKGTRAALDVVTSRLRSQLAAVAGASLILAPLGDTSASARSSAGSIQYTLRSDDVGEIEAWAPRLLDALRKEQALADVSSDMQLAGLKTNVDIDRATASRLGLNVQQIDNTLYDAFGQRPVSTIYKPLNQYRVVMEVAPRYWQDPALLDQLWVSTAGGSPSGTAHDGRAVGHGDRRHGLIGRQRDRRRPAQRRAERVGGHRRRRRVRRRRG